MHRVHAVPPQGQASAEQAAALAALKREASQQKVIVQGDGTSIPGPLDAATAGLAAVRGWAPGGGVVAPSGGGGGAGVTGVAAELVVTSGPRRIGQVMTQVCLNQL